jgi:isopenicillin-N N-acyltransferase like protein
MQMNRDYLIPVRAILVFAALLVWTGAVQAERVPLIELPGTPKEIGAGHAKELAEPIKMLHRDYLMAGFKDNPAQQFLALRLARAFDRHLLPEHREEILAMAEELGLEYGEVLLAQSFLDLVPMTGCSTIALTAEMSNDGMGRYGRNLDFPSMGVADTLSVVLVVRPEGRYGFAAVTWPGLIGVLSGMNEHGLTLSNMEVNRPRRLPTAMPYTLLYRMVLEQARTVEEAIELLERTPRQSANTIMLMDAEGDRAVVEITPEAIAVRRAGDDEPLISTNHHRGQDGSSTGRCWRYDKLLAAADSGGISLEQIQSMLHEVAQGKMTMQSMVFEPSNGVIWLATGEKATENPFHRVEVGRHFE